VNYIHEYIYCKKERLSLRRRPYLVYHLKKILYSSFGGSLVVKLVLLFLVSIVLTACSSSSSNDRDHLVFRYNEQYQISTLDPAFARNPSIIWPTNQLFNGLVQLDDSLNVRPDIAKHWTVSEDALRYTFTLRDDVKFHKHVQFKTTDSTRYVNAQDFEYSFNRLTDPKVASPGSWVLNKVASYKATTDSTFTIQLKQAFPAFLGLLSMRYCSVVPKEIVSFYGNDFRSQLPYLEAVAITFLPDKQSEFLQFAQGNIDFLNSLDPSYKDELLTPSGRLREKYKANVDLSVSPQLNTEYIGFFLGSKSQAVQSELLRKAVNYGFDRKKMIYTYGTSWF